MGQLEEEMVASYSVEITGFERTKAELARLTNTIETLRKTDYSSTTSVTQSALGGNASDKLGRKDIFATKLGQMEGRVQTGVQKAMASGMALGRKSQTAALRAAETKTGRKRPGNGPGRDKTGRMIHAIKTNVETGKLPNVTFVTGWHGWARDERKGYFAFQEQGTKGRPSAQHADSLKRRVKARRNRAALGLGVPAANSLGLSVILVREHLKRELKGLR